MANIAATLSKSEGPGIAYTWANITGADTPLSVLVDAGIYMLSVEGTFAGSISVEVKGAVQDTAHKSIPDYNEGTTSLTFTAATDPMRLVTLGRCYILPVRTSGSGANVSVYLRPVPGGLVR